MNCVSDEHDPRADNLQIGVRVFLTPDGGAPLRGTISAIEPTKRRHVQVDLDGDGPARNRRVVVPRTQVRPLDVVERVGELEGRTPE